MLVFDQLPLELLKAEFRDCNFLNLGAALDDFDDLGVTKVSFHRIIAAAAVGSMNRHGVQRQDLSFEIVDALVSLEDEWWRLYGGGGLVVLSGSAPDLGAYEYAGSLPPPAGLRIVSP